MKKEPHRHSLPVWACVGAALLSLTALQSLAAEEKLKSHLEVLSGVTRLEDAASRVETPVKQALRQSIKEGAADEEQLE